MESSSVSGRVTSYSSSIIYSNNLLTQYAQVLPLLDASDCSLSLSRLYPTATYLYLLFPFPFFSCVSLIVAKYQRKRFDFLNPFLIVVKLYAWFLTYTFYKELKKEHSEKRTSLKYKFKLRTLAEFVNDYESSVLSPGTLVGRLHKNKLRLFQKCKR